MHADFMIKLRTVLFALLFAGGGLLAGEIHEAAARGDVALLKTLAARGPAVRSSADQEGLTALHVAVLHRQPEAVAVLLAAGAPVDARDREQQTPLQYAAHSTEETMLENFRSAGGGKFGDALTTLMQRGQAVSPGALLGLLRTDLAAVEDPLQLLRHFASASTAEQMAAEVKCAAALIAAGADVNAVDRERTTPLHHAAMSPEPALAEALIAAGAKVNTQNAAGMTPLHYAALFGGAPTAEFLLTHGAEPEGRSVLLGVPPLVMAVTRGDPRIVTVFLDHRADVNALGPDGETALARATLLGAVDVAKVLVERGARVGARFARINQTPLHVAAARGSVPLVSLFLTHGAEVDARDGGGFTPMMIAAEKGRTLVVRALFNADGKVNSVNNVGRTALWFAASRGHEETVAYLLEHAADQSLAASDGQNPLHIAAFDARPAALRVLLARRPPLTVLSRLGTPLHGAAAGPLLHAILAAQQRPGQKVIPWGTPAESVTCARLLLQAGAPIDAPDANGSMAVQTAAAFGNEGVLELLGAKQKGAFAVRDAQGLTLLHHAARGPILPGYAAEAQPAFDPGLLEGCGVAVTFLISRGVDMNAKDSAGMTPLHLAAAAGNLPALQVLFVARADVRATDKSGATPLHFAAARGRTEAVTAFLNTKARLDAADAEGQTPLHMAVAAGHTETARALLDGGADANAVNRRGQSVLGYAEAYNRPEIAKMLHDRGVKPVTAPLTP
jgi:ankyrin repeat protein